MLAIVSQFMSEKAAQEEKIRALESELKKEKDDSEKTPESQEMKALLSEKQKLKKNTKRLDLKIAKREAA